jgi:hypothetical protein
MEIAFKLMKLKNRIWANWFWRQAPYLLRLAQWPIEFCLGFICYWHRVWLP